MLDTRQWAWRERGEGKKERSAREIVGVEQGIWFVCRMHNICLYSTHGYEGGGSKEDE
jgi:hypothetical protein